MTFIESVLANLIGVLFGAGLGIPIGLWLDRKAQEEAAEKREETRQRVQLGREIDTLDAIKDAIQHNLDILEQAKDDFSRRSEYNVVFYNVDPRAIDLLMPGFVELSSSFDLIRRVNNHRYQLDFLSQKINTQYELEYGAAAVQDDKAMRRDEIIRSIRPHVGQLISDANRLQTEIDEKVDELEATANRTLPDTIS